MRARRSTYSATCLWLIFGCAHYPVNAPLKTFNPEEGYRFQNLSSQVNSDELFVVLTCSGGGTRAAALCYGVLEQLNNTTVVIDDKSRHMLDEVDVISSVSGGSFPAAYYALFGNDLFVSFEGKFLKQNIHAALASKLVWHALRVLSPAYSRIDLAAEYYDDHIFEHKTYGDLLKRGKRPFLIVNATDMTLGAGFEFTQEQFDLLYSDLSSVPVARAVAASSAFPILLTPVTLRNYKERPGFEAPMWVELASEDREVNSRRFREAQHVESYLDTSKRPFIHLIDGGVADNLGTRTVMRSLSIEDGDWSVLRMINLQQIQKVVVIVVNAAAKKNTNWDQEEYAPVIGDVANATIEGLMGNYTFDSVELLKELLYEFKRDARARQDCERLLIERNCDDTAIPSGDLYEIDPYLIEISFDLVEDEVIRTQLKEIDTNFHLADEEVDLLMQAGAEMLRSSSAYQALVESLEGSIE